MRICFRFTVHEDCIKVHTGAFHRGVFIITFQSIVTLKWYYSSIAKSFKDFIANNRIETPYSKVKDNYNFELRLLYRQLEIHPYSTIMLCPHRQQGLM